MNLLRRAKMILEPASMDAQSPFRTLALIACTGMMISYGSYAYCATPAAATAILQDHDHDHDADHHHDHNVVVRGNKLISGQAGRFVIDMVDDSSEHGDDHGKIHDHLVKLLHGQESGKVDHQELARQLRRLADRLEVKGKSAKTDPKANRRFDIYRPREHPVVLDVKFGNDEKDGEHRVVRVESVPDKNVSLRWTMDPRQMTFQRKKDEYDNVQAHDKKYDRFIVRGEEHDHDRNTYYYRVLENKESKRHETHIENAKHHAKDAHENEMHFGHATTSNGELGQVLRELKNEVQQLRREVNQLRSNRDLPSDRPVRLRVQDRMDQPVRRFELRRDADKVQGRSFTAVNDSKIRS